MSQVSLVSSSTQPLLKNISHKQVTTHAANNAKGLKNILNLGGKGNIPSKGQMLMGEQIPNEFSQILGEELNTHIEIPALPNGKDDRKFLLQHSQHTQHIDNSRSLEMKKGSFEENSRPANLIGRLKIPTSTKGSQEQLPLDKGVSSHPIKGRTQELPTAKKPLLEINKNEPLYNELALKAPDFQLPVNNIKDKEQFKDDRKFFVAPERHSSQKKQDIPQLATATEQHKSFFPLSKIGQASDSAEMPMISSRNIVQDPEVKLQQMLFAKDLMVENNKAEKIDSLLNTHSWIPEKAEVKRPQSLNIYKNQPRLSSNILEKFNDNQMMGVNTVNKKEENVSNKNFRDFMMEYNANLGHEILERKGDFSLLKTEAPSQVVMLGTIQGGQKEVINQIQNYLQQSAIQGEKSLGVVFHHQDLGKVSLFVERQDTSGMGMNSDMSSPLSIHIQATRPEAQEFFMNHKDQLVQHLHQSGIQVSDFRVEQAQQKFLADGEQSQSSFYQQQHTSENHQGQARREQRQEVWQDFINSQLLGAENKEIA